VFDEAHHYVADAWGQVAAAYKDSVILGLTATPERGDGRGLGDLFDHLVPVSSVRELQALGVLVPCITYAPSSPTKDLSADPVAAYLARTPGERAFVFAAGVAHAEKLAIQFCAAGVPAATIHGRTPDILRRARLEAFRLQDPQPLLEAGVVEKAPLVLTNAYVLTEGIDVPEASCCILSRGCGHPGMMLQMVGRVLRAAPGKTRATFIDLRGVVHKLGLPEADREWSLEGKAAKLGDRDRDIKLKTCPSCSGAFAAWAVDSSAWRVCPLCGTRVAAPDPGAVSPRELHPMGGGASPAARQGALRGLARAASHRAGNRAGWVAHRYHDKFGEWPPRGAALEALREVGVDPLGPPRAPPSASVEEAS
jgi:superfamily II DNA or RNA helicase